MRLFVAALATLAIAGCTQTPTAAVSPTPSAQNSPSPATDLPVSRVALTCRLPVTTYAAGGDSASYRGGFITFPTATLRPDPAGAITSEYVQQDFVTTATPPLHGVPQSGPPFYDLAKNRWVPAGAGQSAPDGASYAYSHLSGPTAVSSIVIHVVDVAHGTDRTFTVPATPAFGSSIGARVGDYDGAGVYFTSEQSTGPPLGVWRLDVTSGAVSQVSKVLGVAAIDGGQAWLNRIDPRDPAGPQTGNSGPRSNSVVRVDLATGEETVWYSAAGHMVTLLGADRRGAPIIIDAPPPRFDHAALHLVSKPESEGIVIYDGAGGLWFSALQSDITGRLWLGNDRGVYVWTPAVGLQKAFALIPGPGISEISEQMLPAGLCT
jgi:hypothetical protein